MSIVTLKKKTQSRYNNMSVGVKQFSLNGTHRSQGYIGQTMLSRSLPRTLARGNTLRGYGGTNGNFIQHPSILSAVTSTEDPSIVKPSVLSNDGMITTQYRWIKRPQPFTSVKPDNTQNTNTQQDYINNLQSNTIQKIIKRKCQEKNAPLYLVKPQKNYRLISATQTETIFDFAFTDSELELKNIQLNLLGAHQVENCALALTCLALLSKRDKFLLDEKKLRTAMRNITLTGRMEIRKVAKGKTLILDGAHNPQKMTAFTSALKTIFPGQKFDFIVAFKKGKDFQKMLMQILPLANHLFLTNFSTSNQDDHWSSVDNLAIEKFLQQKKFQNFSIIANEQKAVLSAIKNSSHPVVITGSLYLLSSVYGYLKK